MESEVYDVEAKIQDKHWWFVGRRNLFGRHITEMNLNDDVAILDIGTGTGTNLKLLSQLGYKNISGLDFSDHAIDYCRQIGFPNVVKGDITDAPFDDNKFDLILATDVIEHIDDDRKALSEILRMLKPGGKVLITVPAFTSLWGLQDEKSHHKRRYRINEILEKTEDNGLKSIKFYYFNYILFVPIWSARKIIKIFRVDLKSENQVNTSWLNSLLLKVFQLDVKTANVIRPPFGVSIMFIGTKSNQEDDSNESMRMEV